MQKNKPIVNLKSRSYQYAIKLIKVLDSLPKDLSAVVIAKQLLRSATSIGANIVEAHAASSRRDFTNFYTHSLKSANESLYWLNLLKDAKNINLPQLDFLIQETRELSNILASSILTLKGKH
ncbi:MAG: hypothetical protein A2787_08070 [Omnitrophica WOR_2 bacterium RIFCSPHIGHO2_01_FULL_48_9]|nr:MAG: hypothetical protein A3D10_04135 [Omnitrophica WOR_2 bacterium RIFCSPHIGHO2_02_FULL_48_11]OGX31371.1 MAG: hypothetical protein A2787_08070 [Omnitrophica WOR_2 bacterium RIFCSPHIGHO2_01_FULL_48_9]